MIKKLILSTAAIVLFSLLNGQDNRLEDGYHVFRYPNGNISSEGNIRDGKPDGYWKSYYVTGVIKSEGRRRNHLLDSIWVFYTQTGDTLEKIDYLYGKKSGYYLKYKRDRSYGLYIWSRELYASDMRQGTAYLYYPDGSVKQTIPYIEGKKQGLSREYDEEGNIITLYEYNNDFLTSRERINRLDENGDKQGAWKEFYDNGNIKKEMTFRNGLLHGYYKEYNERGILTATMLYDNGKIVEGNVEDSPEVDIRNSYDKDGNLIFSGPFRMGVPVGIHREYNSDGSVKSAEIYNDQGIKVSEGIVTEDGRRHGKWKNFYENGEVKEEGEYDYNRRTGAWTFYNRGGSIVQTGTYRNGRPEGLWKWYYPEGSILREEAYFQGKRDGMFIEYSRDGDIISQGEYLDGERNGDWKVKIGDHTEEGNYIIGLRDGLWKYNDDEGNVLYRGRYIQDNPDGYHFYYYDNGRIKEEQYYDMGLRHRTWKKYNEEGMLEMTITYRDDYEVRINGIKINLPERDVKIIK
ncbi:MAG: toxin-antitoxin system YwqK family antitoxin [Bacteroidota bacterium]